MLRNNEGEWKAIEQKHPGTFGDFNYITNRQTMQNYWEERVKTNGKYENTYTLGLRGIHDYPMEGANSTAERVALMQQAINDQRDMLRRNIHKPVEEIPQVLCTYEEVLDAYHNGLQVPEDVTLLWSDDKHGYCRNLCNPDEMRRKGGAGIYYHLSYHGDPDSWIWLSPLSPAFLSMELTKAYTYGARKIWVFNVGDIKPAEKEISFVMDLAWNLDRWKPTKAHDYIRYWAAKTFGDTVAHEINDIMTGYYQLQAGGKDAHVWFVNYTEPQITRRIREWRILAERAQALENKVPSSLRDAYFELVVYPVRGAAMLIMLHAYWDLLDKEATFGQFLDSVRKWYAGLPYDVTDRNQDEQFYQALFYALMVGIGADVHAEEKTSDGRMDIALKLPDAIYILEFKYNKTSQEALEQILAKDYAVKFASDERPVFAVGLNVSDDRRTIDSYDIIQVKV